MASSCFLKGILLLLQLHLQQTLVLPETINGGVDGDLDVGAHLPEVSLELLDCASQRRVLLLRTHYYSWDPRGGGSVLLLAPAPQLVPLA